jgi:translation initiation factor IF-3
MQIAREHGLDLVEVAPTATPPVCRLLDYGKYKYDQTKKERSAKRGQRIGLLKELRLRPRIEEHDLQAKVRMARKFLEGGNKLRLLVIFRGREVVYPELGLKVLQRVSEALRDIAVVSAHPVREKRTITLTLSPISVKKPKEVKSDAEVENS